MGVVANYVADQRRLLLHIWYGILGCSLVFAMAAIAVASQRNIMSSAAKAPSFVGMWSVFLLIGAALFGSQVLAGTWTTSFHVGGFLGLLVFLSEYFFVIFILFSHFSTHSGLDADALLAAFSFFLFLLTGAFSVLLWKNRASVSTDAPPLPPTPQTPVV